MANCSPEKRKPTERRTSRRQFLLQAGVLAAGLSLGRAPSRGARRSLSASDKLNVGLSESVGAAQITSRV